MTNEEMLQDLKQFIEATVSQQMTDVATKDNIKQLSERFDGAEQSLGARINTLDEKLDAIQDAIADALTHVTEETDAKLEDHEQRLRRLESRAA